VAPFGHPHDHAPQDQGGGDNPQAAQTAGDHLPGQDANDAHRDRPDDHCPGQLVVVVGSILGAAQTAQPGAQQPDDIVEEVEHRGCDGAELDDRRVGRDGLVLHR